MKNLKEMAEDELSQLIAEATALLANKSSASLPPGKPEASDHTQQLESKFGENSDDQFELVLNAKAFKGSEKCWLARLTYNEKHQMVRNRSFIAAEMADKKQLSARVWTERKVYRIRLNDGEWLEFCEAGSAKYDTREIVQYKDGKFLDQRGDEIETDFERI